MSGLGPLEAVAGEDLLVVHDDPVVDPDHGAVADGMVVGARATDGPSCSRGRGRAPGSRRPGSRSRRGARWRPLRCLCTSSSALAAVGVSGGVRPALGRSLRTASEQPASGRRGSRGSGYIRRFRTRKATQTSTARDRTSGLQLTPRDHPSNIAGCLLKGSPHGVRPIGGRGDACPRLPPRNPSPTRARTPDEPQARARCPRPAQDVDRPRPRTRKTARRLAAGPDPGSAQALRPPDRRRAAPDAGRGARARAAEGPGRRGGQAPADRVATCGSSCRSPATT